MYTYLYCNTCVSCRPPYQQTQTAPSCSPSCTTLPGQEGKPWSGPHTRSPGRKWRDSGLAGGSGPSSSSAIGGHEIANKQNQNNFVCQALLITNKQNQNFVCKALMIANKQNQNTFVCRALVIANKQIQNNFVCTA